MKRKYEKGTEKITRVPPVLWFEGEVTLVNQNVTKLAVCLVGQVIAYRYGK